MMESEPQPVSIQNRSSMRLLRGPLTAFAKKVHAALRLKGHVAVVVTSAEEVRRLNREFRRQDRATDVLSFPSDVRGYSGDIAISAEIAAESARARRISVAEETKILLLHGMLHLAGYDHEKDCGEMAAREHALRQRFRLSDSLIARAEPAAARKRRKATR